MSEQITFTPLQRWLLPLAIRMNCDSAPRGRYDHFSASLYNFYDPTVPAPPKDDRCETLKKMILINKYHECCEKIRKESSEKMVKGILPY